MRFLVLLFLCHSVSAVRHSMKYFYTGSSGVPNFPEFVAVGLVDKTQFVHYDSNTMRVKPKQDWMKKITAEYPQYWERQTQTMMGHQQAFKANIDILTERFKQTGGVYIVQWMVGCEWDDETGDVNSLNQFGYDGEDFISLDLKTETWIAAKQQAVITKQKWNHDKADIEYIKYYTHECPTWGKKYLELGRSSLLRTELPSVSLLQKTPSSPVRCHATGFYPDRAALMWRKDGEELYENVDQGEMLPNQDGTFQMSADLDLSSVPPGDWGKYDCVFQLSGVKEDMVTRLDKEKIRSNWEPMNMAAIIIAAVCVLVLVIAGLGFFIYKQKNAKHPPTPVKNPEVREQLNPKPSE